MASKDGQLSATGSLDQMAENDSKKLNLTAQDRADMAGVGKKQRFVVSAVSTIESIRQLTN